MAHVFAVLSAHKTNCQFPVWIEKNICRKRENEIRSLGGNLEFWVVHPSSFIVVRKSDRLSRAFPVSNEFLWNAGHMCSSQSKLKGTEERYIVRPSSRTEADAQPISNKVYSDITECLRWSVKRRFEWNAVHFRIKRTFLNWLQIALSSEWQLLFGINRIASAHADHAPQLRHSTIFATVFNSSESHKLAICIVHSDASENWLSHRPSHNGAQSDKRIHKQKPQFLRKNNICHRRRRRRRQFYLQFQAFLPNHKTMRTHCTALIQYSAQIQRTQRQR